VSVSGAVRDRPVLRCGACAGFTLRTTGAAGGPRLWIAGVTDDLGPLRSGAAADATVSPTGAAALLTFSAACSVAGVGVPVAAASGGDGSGADAAGIEVTA
jgi:hypothetical protein